MHPPHALARALGHSWGVTVGPHAGGIVAGPTRAGQRLSAHTVPRARHLPFPKLRPKPIAELPRAGCHSAYTPREQRPGGVGRRKGTSESGRDLTIAESAK